MTNLYTYRVYPKNIEIVFNAENLTQAEYIILDILKNDYSMNIQNVNKKNIINHPDKIIIYPTI